MARILCVDYGEKRCGLAVTDPLQISVNLLETIETSRLEDYMLDYIHREDVEKVVFGLATNEEGHAYPMVSKIKVIKQALQRRFDHLEFDWEDEYGSSKEAASILAARDKKKVRKNKSKLDMVSAAVILQRYLGHRPE